MRKELEVYAEPCNDKASRNQSCLSQLYRYYNSNELNNLIDAEFIVFLINDGIVLGSMCTKASPHNYALYFPVLIVPRPPTWADTTPAMELMRSMRTNPQCRTRLIASN